MLRLKHDVKGNACYGILVLLEYDDAVSGELEGDQGSLWVRWLRVSSFVQNSR